MIEAFINDTTVSRSGEAADQDTITLIWSFAVAIFAIGGMIGGLLAGTMADRFGRYVSVFLPKIKAKLVTRSSGPPFLSPLRTAPEICRKLRGAAPDDKAGKKL